MKGKMRFLWIPFVACIVLLSCEKEGVCNVFTVSEINGNDSHNFGLNCMQCHKSGGEGKGCFNAAGSVQNAALTAPETSGQVEFYSGPNGTGSLVYTIPIDAKGNFYAAKTMGINGLYPAIKNATGTLYMGSSLSSGACNSCHGISTGALYAN
jgi:mono/diheme cytochrome c family protein